MTLIQIDHSLCLRDGACIDSCPHGLLSRGAEGFPVEVSGALQTCIRCGQCVSVCSTGALENSLLPGQYFQEVAALRRETDPLACVMRTRRSIRAFKSSPLDKTELKALFDVVRYAPTANNTQNLWWMVTVDREQTKILADLARQWMRRTYWPDKPDSQWAESDDPVLRGAPHLALCCAPEDSRWGATDAAIAVTHLDLLASSRGIGACWAGVFIRAARDWPPLAEELALPAGQKIYGGLFLGRPRHSYFKVPPRKPSAVNWR